MSATKEALQGVLIVGGGLVGASLAIELCRRRLPVTLVETRAAGAAIAPPERERYLALSRASINALATLGVWSLLEAEAASIRAVHVSRRGDFGRLLLRAAEYGVDRFGAVVPASRLGIALEAALRQATGLARLAPATLAGFVMRPDGIEAHIDADGGERVLHADVLVGADGAESLVRGHAGLIVEREDYEQDATVLSIGLTRDHEGIAYERFTDDGAIALLPLSGRRAGLVWTLPRERAEQVQALDEAALIEVLQTQFGDRLGRFHSPGHRVRHPLTRSFAPETTTGRVVLIGNAAQSLHPVAAQGFNLGLRDALVLSEQLVASGDAQVAGAAELLAPDAALAGYSVRRKRDRERIASLSHALARWPGIDAHGAGILRSFVFAAFNTVPALRESLVLAAMGFGDDVPLAALDRVA